MMKSKVLVKVVVPVIEEKFDIYIPINKKIGNIINNVANGINEIANGCFEISDNLAFYEGIQGQKYKMDDLVRNTNIRNGSTIVLM